MHIRTDSVTKLRPRRQALAARAIAPSAAASGELQRLVAAGGVLATALLCLLLFVDDDGTIQPILIGLTAAVCLAPAGVRLAQGRFDPFEPLVIACAAFFVLFVLRPVWMWAADSWFLGIYDLREGLTGAAGIAFVGVAAFVAGYSIEIGRGISRKIPAVPDNWNPQRVVAACFVMLLGAAILFTFFIGAERGLGGVVEYFSGRDNEFTRSLTRNAFGDQASSAYFYLAPYVSVPLSLVLLEVWRRERKPLYAVLGMAVLGIVLLMTIPRGDRTYILALLMPLAMVWYIGRHRRPSFLTVTAAIVLSMIAANVLIEHRTRVDRTQSLAAVAADAASDPFQAVDRFMLGADVSMMSVLGAEYTVMPDQLDFSPGQTGTAALTRWIPSTIWRGKPQDPQLEVHQTLFPANASRITAGFAPSMFGSFYADSGFVGVFAYSLVIGLGVRILFEYWRANRENRGVTLFYAAVLASLVILIRANPAAMLGLSIFLVAPIVAAFWWGARGAPKPKAQLAESDGAPLNTLGAQT